MNAEQLETWEQLEAELLDAKDLQAEAERRYSNAREKIFRLMDSVVGYDAPCTLRSEATGDYYQRQMRPAQKMPMIDWDKVKANLNESEWETICYSCLTPDEDLLLRAIEDGIVSQSVLEGAITYREPKPYLVPRKASEAEKEEWINLAQDVPDELRRSG